MKGRGKHALHASLLTPLNDSSSAAPKSLEFDSAKAAKSPEATNMSAENPSIQTTTDEPNTPATNAASNFAYASPGINGAMQKHFLKGKVFILVRLFVEVNTDAAAGAPHLLLCSSRLVQK